MIHDERHTPADLLEDVLPDIVDASHREQARLLAARFRDGWPVTECVAKLLAQITGVEAAIWLNAQRRSNDDC